jgi:hypothetical protein
MKSTKEELYSEVEIRIAGMLAVRASFVRSMVPLARTCASGPARRSAEAHGIGADGHAAGLVVSPEGGLANLGAGLAGNDDGLGVLDDGGVDDALVARASVVPEDEIAGGALGDRDALAMLGVEILRLSAVGEAEALGLVNGEAGEAWGLLEFSSSHLKCVVDGLD